MSKSDPEDAQGVIRLLDPAHVISKKIRRPVTDSDGQVRYDPGANPGLSNLIDILAAVTDQSPQAAGITTYGKLKNTVAEAIIASLDPIRVRHNELLGDPVELQRILATGADKARTIADPLLATASTAMGVTQ